MGTPDQPSLFEPDPNEPLTKTPGTRTERMRVLITVKAAPNPSETYGETVCVAGIRIDQIPHRWIRLYPINFRELDNPRKFHKYDIVSLEARPAVADPRPESYRPVLDTVRSEKKLVGWSRRKPFIIDHVQASMCEVLTAVRDHPPARSLAAIRPRLVKDLEIRPHGGWDPSEQAKIDRYVRQEDLLSTGLRTALEAPRFKGWYRYLCQSPNCKGHRQGIYDWEWVALQRRFSHLDDVALTATLRRNFFDQMCGPAYDTVFYVGNQKKHQNVFMILGVFYPKR
ncbi:hypothetical protein E1264_08280 [Actinomadura sp. KC216]|uniref:hypothetical protein n=1 Tax=Actinomadura sp. KC216 TaxID=2530370 RepID=UPI00104ED172|nr:hypothetical protein [Actinomadura sp. KC216]TDB89403.1 hypothetical protein E1264_08280 [Actinomadura sp. KC216]